MTIPAMLLNPDGRLPTAHNLAVSALITVAFGLFAYLLRGVSRSGAVAGTLVAFCIYLGLGPGGFLTLFAVFVLTWLATRLGRRRKQQLGLAESVRGRNAGQVLANVAAAAIFSLLALTGRAVFAIAAIASMAEAAADTASSEVGEVLSQRAWLITSFRSVKPGADGGISLAGSLAGVFASFAIAVVASSLHIISWKTVWITALAGYAGTIVDSFLGATLERAHCLNNNEVNFLSTIAAGLIALLLPR